ncbi:MAG: DNA-3-methyladenine glycosylase [Verrucomicrobia bacterium]|nr:DNA-3-methyladenine glycosylase [Verrucomicrobiota bacterium]
MNRQFATNAAQDAAATLLGQDFFARDPLVCAADLIGCELAWGDCRGIVVETEAYAALGDEACHTFLRRGAQKFVDEHPAGTAYIYLNYGVHWLLNALVKGRAGAAADGFVLIRALEPVAGLAEMRARRGPAITDDRHLCSGPGKLTQALGVPPAVHGHSLCVDPRRGFHARASDAPPVEIVTDVRIGISRAADLPWRFLLKNNRCVSRPPARRIDGANQKCQGPRRRLSQS